MQPYEWHHLFFTVKAANPGGDSAYSNEVSATPQVTVPSAPIGVAATGGNAKVTLSWNSVTGATEYKVYQSATSGSFGTVLATVTGSVYSYEAIGLANGITYYFVIKATNAGGDSEYSNEASATPQDTVPSAPIGVTATGGNAKATLSWNSVTGATGYKVYQSTTSGSFGTILATGE